MFRIKGPKGSKSTHMVRWVQKVSYKGILGPRPQVLDCRSSRNYKAGFGETSNNEALAPLRV